MKRMNKQARFLRNKKAWLRTVEAFIAIMLVASALLFIASSKAYKPDKSEEIYKIERAILQEIALNDNLRQEVLNVNEEVIREFVELRISSSLGFEIRICEISKACGMRYYIDKEIYAEEVLISSTLQDYNPKKLKIFVWEK